MDDISGWIQLQNTFRIALHCTRSVCLPLDNKNSNDKDIKQNNGVDAFYATKYGRTNKTKLLNGVLLCGHMYKRDKKLNKGYKKDILFYVIICIYIIIKVKQE